MQSGSLQGASEQEEVNTHSRGFQEKKKKRKQCFENLEDWMTLKALAVWLLGKILTGI